MIIVAPKEDVEDIHRERRLWHLIVTRGLENRAYSEEEASYASVMKIVKQLLKRKNQ